MRDRSSVERTRIALTEKRDMFGDMMVVAMAMAMATAVVIWRHLRVVGVYNYKGRKQVSNGNLGSSDTKLRLVEKDYGDHNIEFQRLVLAGSSHVTGIN